MADNWVENKNPATGTVLGRFPLNEASEIAGIVAKSRDAQAAWAGLPYRVRSQAMARVRRLVASRADELAATISANSGKTLIDALATEILPAILAVSFYRKRGRALARPRRARGGSILLFNKRSRIVREPYGVVGIISPWNYPFAIPFSEVLMALLAGNGAVLKVASDSLAVGEALAKCFHDAGLPEGLFAYVNLPGREAGQAFIDAGIDKLFFTGSTEVGKELMRMSIPKLLPLVLELGGNDAAIVRADADLDRAAAGIVWAGLANAGQSCGGIQRVLVQRSAYEELASKLKARVEALRIGVGKDFDTDMGCLASKRQKELVEAQVEACLKTGARVLAQSPLPESLEGESYMPAIVLGNAAPDSPIMKEEVFGPVVALVAYESDEDAIRIANDSSYGLTSSVWSRDRAKARAIAARINAGAIMVNDHLMSHGLAETPWGGFGDSGLGRTHGEIGFQEMLRVKVIVDDIMPGAKKQLWWHPYSVKVYKGLKGIIKLVAGKGPFARIGAIPRVLSFFFRYWEKK